MHNLLKIITTAAFMAALILPGCNCEEQPPETPDIPQLPSLPEENEIVERDPLPEWIGEESPEQINALKEMNAKQLVEFLDEFKRHPALRVEAMRLLVEKQKKPSEFIPPLLKSLRAPTIREREAALYYLSQFGTPNHIVTIEASVEGVEDCVDYSNLTCNCITYSVECTIKQILERASNK
jgi:hypothetical protein